MEKESNIKTVAKLAGVSISTVSRVLNCPVSVREELRVRVKKAIQDTGYSANPIASTLKSARRNQIAIVIPSLRQTYFTDIIKGISDFCYKKQVMPTVLETTGEFSRERSIIANLERQWVDGIILIPSKSAEWQEDEEYAHLLAGLSKKEQPIPVVIAEGPWGGGGHDCVRIDYKAAFACLTYHLLEIGRKRIAYLGDPKDAPMYAHSRAGYQMAMEEYNCPVDERLILSGQYTVLDGYFALKRLLEEGIAFDGVVCSNDQVASGALQACNEQNISIPQEVAITGFGGVALSIITTPAISTMIVPRYEIGLTAARMLFERIDGYCGEDREVVLQAHLAIRNSTLKSAFKRVDAMFAE